MVKVWKNTQICENEGIWGLIPQTLKMFCLKNGLINSVFDLLPPQKYPFISILFNLSFKFVVIYEPFPGVKFGLKDLICVKNILEAAE